MNENLVGQPIFCKYLLIKKEQILKKNVAWYCSRTGYLSLPEPPFILLGCAPYLEHSAPVNYGKNRS